MKRRTAWAALSTAVLLTSISTASPNLAQPVTSNVSQASQKTNISSQLDPQVQALLQQMASSGTKPATTITAMREGYRAVIPLAGKPESVYKIEDRQIPATTGNIKLRIYTPSSSKNLPVLVYFHGGGFKSGGLDTHDTPLRALANRSGSIIVAVDYRLAPEHQFPAAPEDGYTAVKWVASHAVEFGGDANRIAVGGDSAGGTIATVVAQIARDRKGTKIVYQVLIYPNTDATMSSASWRELGNKGYILSTKETVSNYEMYVPKNISKKNSYVSPLWTKDLTNLPPTLIITAEFDPLRDEGEAYAAKLQKANVPVVTSRYPGMIHGFFQMGGVVDKGQEAINETAQALKTAFAQ